MHSTIQSWAHITREARSSIWNLYLCTMHQLQLAGKVRIHQFDCRLLVSCNIFFLLKWLKFYDIFTYSSSSIAFLRFMNLFNLLLENWWYLMIDRKWDIRNGCIIWNRCNWKWMWLLNYWERKTRRRERVFCNLFNLISHEKESDYRKLNELVDQLGAVRRY